MTKSKAGIVAIALVLGLVLGVAGDRFINDVNQSKASEVKSVAKTLDYQTIVATEFRPRSLAALKGISDGLIAAGLSANRVSYSEVDTTDLRFQLTATRAGKTIIAYIELTDASHAGGARGTAIFTLWVESNGVELTTSYTPGFAQPYTTDDGLSALLVKLSDLELKIPEAAVKVRAAIGL